jgi:ribosomal protein L22
MSPAERSDPREGEAAEPERIEAEATAGKDAPKAGKDAPKKEAPKKEAAKKPARARKTKASADAQPPAEATATAEGEEKRARATGEAPEQTNEQGPARAPASETPAPAASPRRAAKGVPRAPRRRVVRARARYVRTSARKARLVCVHLRGKSVQEARAILAFTPRDVARDWSKLLESAVANAEGNHELLEDDLVIHEAYADEGPTIKRFRPRAMGRATPIRKRTSHLTIALTPSQRAGTDND